MKTDRFSFITYEEKKYSSIYKDSSFYYGTVMSCITNRQQGGEYFSQRDRI